MSFFRQMSIDTFSNFLVHSLNSPILTLLIFHPMLFTLFSTPLSPPPLAIPSQFLPLPIRLPHTYHPGLEKIFSCVRPKNLGGYLRANIRTKFNRLHKRFNQIREELNTVAYIAIILCRKTTILSGNNCMAIFKHICCIKLYKLYCSEFGRFLAYWKCLSTVFETNQLLLVIVKCQFLVAC